MSRSLLRMDVSPLRGSGRASFRILYASRSVTLLGTQATDVALLVQAKQLTGSAFAVGLLGVAELVPLVVFGLYGGVLADRLDRRRLLRWCEAGLGLLAAGLAGQRAGPPSGGVAAVRPGCRDERADRAAAPVAGGGHPAHRAPGRAGRGRRAAVRVRQRGRHRRGHGGRRDRRRARRGLGVRLRHGELRGVVPAAAPAPAAAAAGHGEHPPGPGLRAILAGLRYARRRPDLLGSYLADLAAMTLSYPNALIPFMAANLHATWATGLMFAAPSAGSLAVSATGGWLGRVRRYGRAIALAAAGWGLAITGFGLAPDLAVALGCLTAAGAADMLSGIFRDTLWNQTIPDGLRGRLAGVEMLSYSVGPSAGQLRAGGVASVTTPRFAAASGGLLCVAAVGVVCLALPGFWRFTARPAATQPAPEPLAR